MSFPSVRTNLHLWGDRFEEARRPKSRQNAEIIHDAAVAFCARFVDQHSRTVDPMVPAVRSGKQTIAEGSMASGASTKTELTMAGVARGNRRSERRGRRSCAT